jgi:hypothetical protein
MLDSVPIPFQVILWPLLGGALIVALGRVLPNWARRLLAIAASLASLLSLWSLRTETAEQVEIVWKPVLLFRMSPTLYADGLALTCGILFAGITVALALGITGRSGGTSGRGTTSGGATTSGAVAVQAGEARQAEDIYWHGLMLVFLAACLTMILSANLVTLALGSALLDFALLSASLWGRDSSSQASTIRMSMVAPGVASTLLLFLSALQMDAQAGHASLLAQSLPEGALFLVGMAGMLRALVYPLHPRGSTSPTGMATLLLPVSAGLYVLARVQALIPVLSAHPWVMAVAVFAFLAGGLMAWSSLAGRMFDIQTVADRPHRPVWGTLWPGMLVYQTGIALAFVLLLAGVTPWPLVTLVLVVGVLAIWWDGSVGAQPAPEAANAAMEKQSSAEGRRTMARWWAWLAGYARSWLGTIKSYAAARFPRLRWEPVRWIGRLVGPLLPMIALASIVGAPLTVGAHGRWTLYAAWLKKGDPALLIALAADTFMAAALWMVLRVVWTQMREQRRGQTRWIRPSALLAVIVLVISILVLGLAPGMLNVDQPGPRSVGLKAADTSGVSAWGLGLLYVLPWLVGAWLARLRRLWAGEVLKPVAADGQTTVVHGREGRALGRIGAVINLDWFYRAASWLARGLEGALHWLGQVGEGDGWWGWALIILAVGAILFTAR